MNNLKKTLSDFPNLVKELHPSKNGNIDPSSIRYGVSKRLWWQCSKGDDHIWETTVNNRTSGSGCPICSGRLATPSTCLVIVRPDIAKEWHPNKNADLSPYSLLPASGKKVWWQCDKEHEWKTAVFHRTSGQGCPICAGNIVTPDHNLKSLFPKIAKEWHPTKNRELTPDTVMPKSARKVWWQCPIAKDHEYKSAICARTSAGTGCPICAGRQVIKSTCLATLRPEVANEWHPTKNLLSPFDVSLNSTKKIWWQCIKFQSHIWSASVTQRTNLNSGCPKCRNSQGEKLITQFLEEHDIPYKSQFKFDNCRHKKQLPFDFAILSNNQFGIIEFQGEQHFRSIPYWGGDEKFTEVCRNDQIKKEFCDDHRIPFIAIPYWDKENIPALLNQFIESIKCCCLGSIRLRSLPTL